MKNKILTLLLVLSTLISYSQPTPTYKDGVLTTTWKNGINIPKQVKAEVSQECYNLTKTSNAYKQWLNTNPKPNALVNYPNCDPVILYLSNEIQFAFVFVKYNLKNGGTLDWNENSLHSIQITDNNLIVNVYFQCWVDGQFKRIMNFRGSMKSNRNEMNREFLGITE